MNARSDKYAENLGKLAGNMQSLEFLLRACLLNDEITGGSPTPPDFHELVQGDIVAKNAFTSYDTLRKLIQEYNRSTIAEGLKTDESLAEIRDAIHQNQG